MTLGAVVGHEIQRAIEEGQLVRVDHVGRAAHHGRLFRTGPGHVQRGAGQVVRREVEVIIDRDQLVGGLYRDPRAGAIHHPLRGAAVVDPQAAALGQVQIALHCGQAVGRRGKRDARHGGRAVLGAVAAP